jgi:mannose-6-phosphate isomerase-like protein (cupin superfamily)
MKLSHSFESVHLRPATAHEGTRPILCNRAIAKADGSACNFVDFAIVPTGADIGIHTHERDNEEIYIVISGRGMMHLDGEDFEIGPGHVVVNRPGGTHGLRNTGREELRLIVIEVPAR